MNYSQLPQKELIRGIKFWQNPKNKLNIVALNYIADPDKDPERNGKEWYEQERSITPKAKWEKEYEWDFSAKAGKLIYWPDFCDFNPWTHFIDSFNVKGELILAGDFWQSNPTALLVWCYTNEWILYIIDEYYKPWLPSVTAKEATEKFLHIFQSANPWLWLTEEKLREMDVDKRRDLYYNTFQIMVIDPTTRAKNRSTTRNWEEIPYSVKEDFFDHGIDFELWNNDVAAGITRVREYFQIWKNWKAHLYIFKDRCPNLCWELQRYKYKEQTEGQERRQNDPETPQKKHDHANDALRYLVMTRPVHPAEVKHVVQTRVQRDIASILKPKVYTNEWDVDN